ncbi:DUF1310 family protein [Gemella morbillorum]|uniref:DUF1310 family protein n=1 Tax=Gemella morbillorum TaxID=29391 RepID=UPI001CAF657D|nr:DUF1310 family protein [Gemella morbillorum]MBF1213153.1 DUF1310 family protein [Gemella morbillorum]
MKKVLIGILTTIAIIATMIIGKIQMDKYRIKSIAHGEEGKAAIENMLKIMDEKALTPEGKIKSYKIDESYTHKNPMGGLTVRVIINDDPELDVETTLNKYPSRGKLEHGVMSVSPKLAKLTPAKGKLYDEENNIKNR